MLTPFKFKRKKKIIYQLEDGKAKIDVKLEDGTYSGTDSVKYPFKIIHHELEIKCRFYDLRGSFATICLRNGCEIKDIGKKRYNHE